MLGPTLPTILWGLCSQPIVHLPVPPAHDEAYSLLLLLSSIGEQIRHSGVLQQVIEKTTCQWAIHPLTMSCGFSLRKIFQSRNKEVVYLCTQNLRARYYKRERLEQVLDSLPGFRGNYKLTMREDEWILEGPREVTDVELEYASPLPQRHPGKKAN
ncbi:hypothetical protein BU25DRAFT_59205 [Macroventuria anomochaeta]|uniref:Uncharacterized protein n=1 Tax=Macroventuria anomochaeta TaxID=301207 RepID=A0ACB6S3D5_9PLEO|nr:uncharacterized protein BU25DRAFT_59205 [Macroventuria anomochaeta]KAF2627714.1 hypothetical protein BU25DRAFT_59205 [Macroventuria anomochaeta]